MVKRHLLCAERLEIAAGCSSFWFLHAADTGRVSWRACLTLADRLMLCHQNVGGYLDLALAFGREETSYHISTSLVHVLNVH
jgi:hypothetical protein